tara:strand:- start:55586 stop:55909 length:324 start_codon:yes stop_codon:yes gene_type:complete
MKKIEETYFNGSQSVEFKGIYEHKENKLKIHIDIDSYDRQSSANIYIFNQQDLKWNHLDSIPYSQMASIGVHCYRKVEKNGVGLHFMELSSIEQDVRDLKKKARQII